MADAFAGDERTVLLDAPHLVGASRSEVVDDDAGGVGDEGVVVLGVGLTAVGHDDQDDGRAAGRPGDGDVVAGAVAAGTGLVPDLPVTGHTGPDQGVSGGVAAQPVDEEPPVRGGQDVAEDAGVQAGGERFRGAGVASVAGSSFVQRGFVPDDPSSPRRSRRRC